MKIEQFTRGLVDGWPSELRRGGGSVVVNPDGTISAVGDTDITGDLTLTGGVVYGALIGADVAGAIEWDGSNFRGYTGAAWVALDVQAASGGGWTDDGTVVRLTLATDDVHIGAATAPGVKLKVTGNVIVTGTFTGAAGSFTTLGASGQVDFTNSNVFQTRIAPAYFFIESDASADNGVWKWIANDEQFRGAAENDGQSNRNSWIEVDRTGIVIDLVAFPGTAVTVAGSLGSTGLITATAGVQYGTTVTLTEATANLLALATGDSFHIVSGAMGIGAVPSANADLLLEAGRLMLKESATPTADTGYGKVYTKTDDKLYFQDGAGVEHTFSVADYAAIRFDDNSSAETIDLTDLYHLVTRFATNGLDEVSTADQANNRLTIGASRDYNVALCGSAQAAGGSKVFVFDVFEISQSTANITAITQATPGVVTASGHGFSNGDLCKITGVVGMTEVNDKIYKVAGVSGANFNLQDDEGVNIATGAFGAWSSGGTVALATKTFAHSDRTFSNASGFGAFGSHWYYLATSGDAMEFYIKNKSDATDITFEHLNLTVKAL